MYICIYMYILYVYQIYDICLSIIYMIYMVAPQIIKGSFVFSTI